MRVQNFYMSRHIHRGEDWLHRNGASIEFNPTVFIVNCERMSLEGPPDGSVVIEEVIKLPTQNCSGRKGRVDAREKDKGTGSSLCPHGGR